LLLLIRWQATSCLVDEKIKLNVLAPLKLLTITNFENPSSNPLQRPKAAILTLKMFTGSRL
jgi:hypothetical protein